VQKVRKIKRTNNRKANPNRDTTLFSTDQTKGTHTGAPLQQNQQMGGEPPPLH
jgi:hypothetical protein